MGASLQPLADPERCKCPTCSGQLFVHNGIAGGGGIGPYLLCLDCGEIVLKGIEDGGEGEVFNFPMNRRERKELVRDMRKQALAWPEHLVEVPESEWPPRRGIGREYPCGLWRSRHFLVQRFDEPPFGGVEVRRLSVNRVTLGMNGHWDHTIPWDDLQRCKRETGHGDWYGVEIYPRDRDLVHIANSRHLWLLAEPLALGWFR